MKILGLEELMTSLADWAAGKAVTVYLFGSRARGYHQADSDVDLYVAHANTDYATALWWTEQNATDFSKLRRRLPGPLKLMGPESAAYPLTLPHHEIARKGNVVALHTPQKPANKRMK